MAQEQDKPNALKENLREQTIIIEDCTADLKALLNKRVYDGTTYDRFVKEADKLIENGLQEVSDEEMRINALSILRGFARREFKRLRASLMTIVGFSFVALKCVLTIWNSAEVKPKEKAYKVLQSIEPQFAGVSQSFESGAGQSWRWATPLNEYMQDYMRTVRQTSAFLAQDRAKGEDGLSLRLKSELYVRAKWQDDNMRKLRESGARLVWISSHVNCSERCQPYQGRLYSLDGTSGVSEDGHQFVPIEVATDRYTMTKAGKVYKNGTLSGFGCRHFTIPYKPKGETPLTYDASEIEKARAIEQEQRQLEREVYKARENYYSYRGVDNVKARIWYHKAAEGKKAYIEFCNKNKVAWYPDRIKVYPH